MIGKNRCPEVCGEYKHRGRRGNTDEDVRQHGCEHLNERTISAELQELVYSSLWGISHFYHPGHFLCGFVFSPDLLPVRVLFPQH